MSAINQSPDFALAVQKVDSKVEASPQLTANATAEPNQTDGNTQKQASDFASNEQHQQTEKQLDHDQLEKVAQQLQDFMGEMNRSLQFKVDEESGRDVIKVIDKSSGDVIKQYPSEEVLSLVAKLSETAGMLIDQSV
ncbi:flagellar protein FlaG [Pseudoalteromonas sp. S4741]|uniref:flagellar protein FlaG n=1 Tax=Pseudoalteromonas sp. S4741 TaxID=579563 RepID=UPI00110B1F90|nr:flagellar protein FlaG [Pseudoalteromonas sp. S4741]TMO23976.1 flagellin [Pseudoalteromonas sp. S4741]